MPDSRADAVRRRRWPWIVLAAAAGLLALAVVAAPLLLDVERYRGRVEQALRATTGWQPELGQLQFSVLRGLVLTVRPAKLTAPEGGSEIVVDSLQVRADLLPLLRGRLLVRRIELLGPRIDLVRPTEERGWVLPLPPGGLAAPAGNGAPTSGGLTVSIEEVELRGGRLRLDDRSTRPPRAFTVDPVRLVAYPERAEFRLEGGLPEGGGTFEVAGKFAGGAQVRLNRVATAALRPFVGEDLLGAGGTLSGTVDVEQPLTLRGRLTAENLLLLAGERPLDAADLSFAVSPADGGWRLDDLVVTSGGVELRGSGRLAPDVDLELRIPESPLEPVLRAARAAIPVPLTLEPPGAAGVTLRVGMKPGQDPRVSARGTVSASGLRLAEFLPPARDLRTEFTLSPGGALEVRVLQGQAAGGPLAGTVRLDSVFPPGRLTFDGELQNAAFGELVRGFVGGSTGKVTGPAGVRAKLGLDLRNPTLDARALGGALQLNARELRAPGWDIRGAIRKEIEDKLGGGGGLGALLSAVGRGGDAARDPGGEPGAAGAAGEVVRELLDSLEAGLELDAIPWKIQGLSLAAGGLTAQGGGSFDPLENRVDLELSARLDAGRTGELVRSRPALEALVDRNGQLTVPLRIRGGLLAPEIRVDLGRAARTRIDAERPEEALKDRLKGLLDKRRD